MRGYKLVLIEASVMVICKDHFSGLKRALHQLTIGHLNLLASYNEQQINILSPFEVSGNGNIF